MTEPTTAADAMLARLDSMALRTRASAVATGQNAAAIVRTMLPAVQAEARATAEAQVTELIGRLLTYAQHFAMCDTNKGIGRFCTCGFKDVLRSGLSANYGSGRVTATKDTE